MAYGASRTLNPSLPQRVVDRALEKDRTRATAEYLAEFRTDVEGRLNTSHKTPRRACGLEARISVPR